LQQSMSILPTMAQVFPPSRFTAQGAEAASHDYEYDDAQIGG